MDAIRVSRIGGTAGRHAADVNPVSITRWIHESAKPGVAAAHNRILDVLIPPAAAALQALAITSIKSLSAVMAWALLMPAAHAIYYGAPIEAGDLSQPLKTPWVFYDYGYGFDGCFDSEQAITDAWIAWRVAGGACAARYTGKDLDWPADPATGLTIDVPRGCVPVDEYNIPQQNSIPLVRQHARFQFEKLIYACTASDWHQENWVLHREAYEYCPEGYAFSLLTGTPWVHFCKREKPVYDQCLLEGNKLLSIGTGSKKHADVDFTDTRDGHLHLQRYYNSNYSRIVGKRQDQGPDSVPAVGMFGANWRSSYEKAMYFPDGVSGTLAGMYRDDATFQFFNRQPDGSWVSNSDIRDTLTETANGWNYRTSDDAVEMYDLAGRLQSVHYLDGAVSSLSYDTGGRLHAVHSSTGESLTFYDDPADVDQLVDSVTDHTGRVWKYVYDARSNLEYVVYPDATAGSDADNPVRTYHYENTAYPNALTGITDERGVRYATFAYDGNGRATSGYQGDDSNPANRIDVDYHHDDHLGDGIATRTVTDSRGNQSVYTTIHRNGVALLSSVSGAGCVSCGNGDSSYSYEPLTNNLLSSIENGVTTEFGNYDANGNPGFRVEARGTAEQRRTDYSYDARFHKKITKLLEPSVFAADPAARCTEGVDCRKTSYSYDAQGNRLQEVISGFAPDGTPLTRKTTYQYNGPLHQLTLIDGPRTDVNDITSFDYYPDDPAEGARRARLKRVTAADGTLLRDNIGYTPTGKLASEYRPNNILATYDYYPGNDRLQAATVHDLLSGSSSRTAWTYLPTGEVKTVTLASLGPDAATLSFDYDAARRLTRIMDGLGNYIDYTLDPEGNRTGEHIHDSGGVLRRALSRTFDAYNRLDISMSGSDPSNALERVDSDFAADGTLDRQTDGNGIVTGYSYDSLKRLLSTTQDSGGVGALTQYGYDAADHLTSVTDPVEGSTSYIYDDLGNLLSITSPDTGTTLYTYDAAGNRTSRQEDAGRVISYSYDALNRLTGVDAPGTEDDIAYAYDNCTNGSGRLCRITQGGVAVSYTYDAFGNVTGHQQLFYSYDAASRIKTVTYPSGAVVTYSYDAAGQVSQVDLTANGATQTLASGIRHAPFGPLTELTFGNGVTLTQDLDTAYRLATQSVPGVLERGYTRYDGNGNLETWTDALFGGGSNFAYDTLNRLDSGSGFFGARDYDYDLNGNRTQLVSDGATTNYGYIPQTNRLNIAGGWSYTLDTNGNTTHKLAADGLGLVYTYNSHNRMVAVAERSITGSARKGKNMKPVIGDVMQVAYDYNGLGQRVIKTLADGAVTQFLYGTGGLLMAELDGTGVVMREYVYLDDQLLAVLDPQGAQAYPAADVIVDNDTTPAGWFRKTSNQDYGADYLYSGGDSGGIYRWTPSLPAGTYDVSAWYVDNRKNSTQVPYAISHNGELDTAFVDQSRNGGSWQLIAQNITFDGAGGEYIEVSDVNGRTIADAVRLVKVAGIPEASTTVVSYVHNDHLGTPQVMTDAAGSVVWRAIYDPFGMASIDPASTQQLNVRFPGQYYDNETGLHYNYYRYYDPSVSRYLSADPGGALLDFSAPERQVAARAGVVIPDGKPFGYVNHSFNYVDNNPVMSADPTGEIDPVTAGLIVWGLLYVNHAGDAISNVNGNVWGRARQQDNKCTLGPVIGPIGDLCFPERCKNHDICYAENSCNSSSWASSVLGGTRSCNQCNSGFFK